MSEVEQELQEIEVSIEEADKAVKKKETLKRLMKNPDFIAVIEEDYLREEAIRLAHLLDHPNSAIANNQKAIRTDLRGIAAFKRYLYTVIQMGNQAEDLIIHLKEQQDELHAGFATLEGEAN